LFVKGARGNLLTRYPLSLFKKLILSRSVLPKTSKPSKTVERAVVKVPTIRNIKRIIAPRTSPFSISRKTSLTSPLGTKRGLGSQKKKIRRFSINPNSASSPITSNLIPTRKFHVSPKLAVLSKHRTSFILSSTGFIFIQNIRKHVNSLLKAKLNRYRYSFFYLNDIKRLFLRRPNHFKLLTTSLFSTRRKKSYPVDINRFASTDAGVSNNLGSKNTLLATTTKLNHFTFKNKFIYNHPFGSYAKREVRIKRIKFKPGYSRI
jgi:hypothetical protein